MRNFRRPLSDGGGLSLVSESHSLRGVAHAQSSRGFSFLILQGTMVFSFLFYFLLLPLHLSTLSPHALFVSVPKGPSPRNFN